MNECLDAAGVEGGAVSLRSSSAPARVSRPRGRPAARRGRRRRRRPRGSASRDRARRRRGRAGSRCRRAARGGRGRAGRRCRRSRRARRAVRGRARVPPDERELVVVERPGLLQDRVRDRELADVVQQAADRECAQPRWRRARAARRSARRARRRGGCAPRSSVLLRQPDHQGPDAGAEERLLGGDDLARPQVARERERLAAAAQVVRDGAADERDTDETRTGGRATSRDPCR